MKAEPLADADNALATGARDPFELDVYLLRIGLTRASLDAHAAGSVGLLHAIAWGQATHIPFENLATVFPTMRQPASVIPSDVRGERERVAVRSSLAPSDIYRKLVSSNRGGFCFEQNLLLARALRELGFDVDLVAAKGVNRAGDETSDGHALSCFTHLVLVAHTADGKRYLLDDGFGWAGAPRQPLELVADTVVEDATTGEIYRLVRGDEIASTEAGFERWGCHRLRVGARGASDKRFDAGSTGWFLQYKPNVAAAEFWDMYHFRSDGHVSAMDCEPGAWFASTHPTHKQTQMKLVALMTDDGRISLVDDVLTIRKRGEVVLERRLVGDGDELRDVLRAYFGIDFLG